MGRDSDGWSQVLYGPVSRARVGRGVCLRQVMSCRWRADAAYRRRPSASWPGTARRPSASQFAPIGTNSAPPKAVTRRDSANVRLEASISSSEGRREAWDAAVLALGDVRLRADATIRPRSVPVAIVQRVRFLCRLRRSFRPRGCLVSLGSRVAGSDSTAYQENGSNAALRRSKGPGCRTDVVAMASSHAVSIVAVKLPHLADTAAPLGIWRVSLRACSGVVRLRSPPIKGDQYVPSGP